MDLRRQVVVLRRYWLLILVAVVVAAAIAGFAGSTSKASYVSQAEVLLLPNDPAESITPGNAPSDLTSYATTQAQLVTSPSVVAAVAKQVGATDLGALAGQVSVGGSNILVITAVDSDPKQAQAIAGDFASGYLAYSKNTAVAALTRTTTVLKAQSDALLAELSAPGVNSSTQSALSTQYAALISQYNVDSINKALAQGNAKLLSDASEPQLQKKTSVAKNAGFGALVGLLVGLAGAFLREQLNDRVRSREEVEGASEGLPVLAELPLARKAVRQITENGLSAAMATELGESARALRTSIMFYTVKQEERRILVTSPSHGDGKTLVSSLLAAAYAQAGFRTVLVSADLRNDGAEQLFGWSQERRQGLTDALLLAPDQARSDPDRLFGDARQFIVSTDVPNLSFLGHGSPAPNPGDLLSSGRMDALLDDLALSYDILILDSAPLLTVSDTRPLVEKVDGVLLVATVGQNRRGIARAIDTLRPAAVPWLGVLLNRAAGVEVNAPAPSRLVKV